MAPSKSTHKLFKLVSVVAGVNQGVDKSDLKCWEIQKIDFNKWKVSVLCWNQRCSHFTRGDRGSCQVQGLRGAAECCRVPIQIILRAHVLQWSRCVAVRHRQSAGVFQAPVALLLLGRNCRIPTPVVRGVTQEDDGCQKTRNRQRRHTKQQENALLEAGKRPNFF